MSGGPFSSGTGSSLTPWGATRTVAVYTLIVRMRRVGQVCSCRMYIDAAALGNEQNPLDTASHRSDDDEN